MLTFTHANTHMSLAAHLHAAEAELGVRALLLSTFCGVAIAGPFNIDNQLNVLPRDLSWNEVRVAYDHE